jgi:hypothetical protein
VGSKQNNPGNIPCEPPRISRDRQTKPRHKFEIRAGSAIRPPQPQDLPRVREIAEHFGPEFLLPGA